MIFHSLNGCDKPLRRPSSLFYCFPSSGNFFSFPFPNSASKRSAYAFFALSNVSSSRPFDQICAMQDLWCTWLLSWFVFGFRRFSCCCWKNFSHSTSSFSWKHHLLVTHFPAVLHRRSILLLSPPLSPSILLLNQKNNQNQQRTFSIKVTFSHCNSKERSFSWLPNAPDRNSNAIVMMMVVMMMIGLVSLAKHAILNGDFCRYFQDNRYNWRKKIFSCCSWLLSNRTHKCNPLVNNAITNTTKMMTKSRLIVVCTCKSVSKLIKKLKWHWISFSKQLRMREEKMKSGK